MTDKSTLPPVFSRFAWTLAATILCAAPGLASSPAGMPSSAGEMSESAEITAPITDERASYSFLRTLEGSATVAAAGQGIGEPLETNQPLLTGDMVRVDSGSRLELTLSDRNRLFLEADTSLVLERLAFSGDREERVTVLRLEGGELLLAVSDEALGDELPRVITANATVYVQEPGEYRVESGVGSDGAGWTRLVTRRGFAEVVTDRGSSIVRAEESIVALGDRGANLELSAADGLDALERWSGVLAERAERASRSASYVESHLAYDAAPLDEAGAWIEVESVRYWRPYVSDGWRPYWQGRWAWTPSGYTWVSYEPWGWVPYHYGRWCSLPGYGWAWRPGAVYSPAWVYWNWTSGYAGWVPMGYYSHFYNPWYSDGFRYGVYGWAGGGWGIYSDWNFAPVHCFRDRRFRGHMRRGRDMERESGHREPPRGLLTTDTRDFRPERLDRTDRTEDLLHQIGKRHQPRTGGDLPDVTEFVGRKGKLPTDVARVVVRTEDKGRGVIRDIDKTPKVAETPAWRRKEKVANGQDDRKAGARVPGAQVPPVYGSGKVRQGEPSAPAGLVLDKPRPARPVTTKVPGAPAAPDSPTSTQGKPRGESGVTLGAPGARSGGKTAGKSDTPRTGVQDPGVPAYAPGAGGAGSNPGQDRQQWKVKDGESAPVQRVVGSVRRPSPGAETKAPGSPAAPGTAGTWKETPSSRGGKTSSPQAPSTSSPSPRYVPENKATQRSPSPRSQPYAPSQPSVKSQPQQPSQRAQPAQPYQPSVKSQPQQRAQPVQPYQPSAKAQPSPRSQPYQPSVKSQPQQRSQPSQPSVKSPSSPRPPSSQPSAKSQPQQRSQPSGKGSSTSQPAGKSPSSGTKGSQRSGQSSPPPKKEDGGRQ